MKLFPYLIMSVLFIACVSPTPRVEIIEDQEVTQEQIDSILEVYTFEYRDPVFIDSSDYVLIPISTYEERNKKRYKSYGSSYYEEPPRYWNILFYNKETANTSLLTESKLRISDYSVNIKRGNKKLANCILYRICDTDYTKNKKLDNNDPTYLFISQIDGSGLKRLSPENEDLLMYKIIPQNDQIIIETKRDINADLAFDHKDENIWYSINLDDDSIPVEIINEAERMKIERLYFDQWLRKK